MSNTITIKFYTGDLVKCTKDTISHLQENGNVFHVKEGDYFIVRAAVVDEETNSLLLGFEEVLTSDKNAIPLFPSAAFQVSQTNIEGMDILFDLCIKR